LQLALPPEPLLPVLVHADEVVPNPRIHVLDQIKPFISVFCPGLKKQYDNLAVPVDSGCDRATTLLPFSIDV
jgi:hypothetical protein